MPNREKAYQSALTHEVASFIQQKKKDRSGGEEGDVEFLSVIDFIEKFKLFPYGLYPVQKFIVKLYYNIPLEDKIRSIKVTDKFNSKILYEFTEKEYLKFLYDQGRCNISEQDGRPRRELILCIGRRSGKSAMSAVFAAYEIYKLLRRGNPQAYYGMPGGSEIRVLCVANDKEQASIVYGDMQSHVESIDYFKNSIANTTQTYLKFRTENDRDRFGDAGKASIVSTFKSSIAKGLRGRGVICSILDEIAFFVDDGRCGLLSNLVPTDRGLFSLGELLIHFNIDTSKTGWSEIDLNIVREDGSLSKATEIYYGGVCPVINLRTSCGYTIGATAEHRVKVLINGAVEWRLFSKIRRNDLVGINRKAIAWPSEYLDISHAYPDTPKKRFTLQFLEWTGRLNDWLSEINNAVLFSYEKAAKIVGVPRKYIYQLDKACAEQGYSLHEQRHSLIHKRVRKYWKPGRIPYDILCYQSHLNLPFKFTNTMGELFGVLAGLNAGCRPLLVAFTGSGESRLTYTLKVIESVFLKKNYKARTARDQSDIYKTWNVHVNGPYLVGLFRHFISPTASKCFLIPRIVLRSPKDVVSSFISAFFSVSGGVKVDSKYVYAYSKSKQVIQDIQLLLLNFGIISSISYSAVDLKDEKYVVKIHEPVSLNIFASEIGLKIPVQCQELTEVINSIKGVPVTESHPIYYFDPVSDITYTKKEVADLRVPDGENYIAQGMTNHNSGAERIYNAIVPSLAQFSPRDPQDKLKPIGPSEGRMILISSPDAKEGFFYRLYQQAMANSKGSSDMLVIQAPTWEVNPTLDSSYYEKEYYKNPNSFMTEHGAEFSDRVRGWIEDSNDLLECINPDLRPVERGVPREIHFAGIDVGLVNDGTCIAITRIHDGKIELVYHEVWYAKRRWRDCNPHLKEPVVPYAYTLQDQIRIDMSEIANWFSALSKRFYIHKAIFDQWSGIVFEQELHKSGLHQFEIRNFFTSESSQMYQTFKMFLYNKQLSLYNYPRPESLDGVVGGRHSPLIAELLELQSTSGGKNLQVVEAPKAPGKHDDMSDALARSVLLASEYIKEYPGILDKKVYARNIDPNSQRSVGYSTYHRMRAQLHGGNKLRTPPKIKPR